MKGLSHVSPSDLRDAKRTIAKYLPKTPLFSYPILSKSLGFETFIKHENHQPTGSFKVRGGIYLVKRMGDEEKEKVIFTASTGNLGISIAYSSMIFGVDAKICMPEEVNKDKMRIAESYGAEVVEWGRDFDESKDRAIELSKERGCRFVAAGDPEFITGVSTWCLEVLEDEPDVDVIIAPVGVGSCLAGACLAAEVAGSNVELWGVSAEGAKSGYLSWREGKVIEVDEVRTFADGLAARRVSETPMEIIWERADDFVVVSDDEIKKVILALYKGTHNVAEGAGAAAMAASMKEKDRLKGKKVVIILSGGNLTMEEFHRIIESSSMS